MLFVLSCMAKVIKTNITQVKIPNSLLHAQFYRISKFDIPKTIFHVMFMCSCWQGQKNLASHLLISPTQASKQHQKGSGGQREEGQDRYRGEGNFST